MKEKSLRSKFVEIVSRSRGGIRVGEAKRRRMRAPESMGKAVRVEIEKSKITGKWLVVAYILRQRYIISPFIERKDAERAIVEVESVFSSISYERWRDLRRGNREVLMEAISKLSYEDDDDEVVGLLDRETERMISKKQNPKMIEDATRWANKKAIVESGKPLFKGEK